MLFPRQAAFMQLIKHKSSTDLYYNNSIIPEYENKRSKCLTKFSIVSILLLPWIFFLLGVILIHGCSQINDLSYIIYDRFLKITKQLSYYLLLKIGNGPRLMWNIIFNWGASKLFLDYSFINSYVSYYTHHRSGYLF